MIPETVAHWVSLSFTISRNLLKLMSVESVMPSNHLVLCRPLLLPSVFPRVRVFSNESALCIRWPKYWSFSLSISLSNECSGLTLHGHKHNMLCIFLVLLYIVQVIFLFVFHACFSVSGYFNVLFVCVATSSVPLHPLPLVYHLCNLESETWVWTLLGL